MSSDQQVRSGPGGTAIMAGLLLGAILAASLPLFIALLVTNALPGVGELRTGGGPLRLVHLLWVYPAMWIGASIATGVAKGLRLRGKPKVAQVVAEYAITWSATTLIMLVAFFEDLAGAFLSASIALLLYLPFVRFLERGAKKDEE